MLLLCVAAARSLDPAANQQTSIRGQQDLGEAIFAKSAPKVVFLITRKSGKPQALASGVILTSDGYIATNYHALQGADTVEIRFFADPSDPTNYQSFNRTVLLYANGEMDIAVLKIKATSLPAFRLRVEDDNQLRIGQRVFAIGNPEGLNNTISEGIVSALRSDEGEDLIQHTAPISHGSSGGALVDSDGLLLGINSWYLAEGQNLNFAISAKHIASALLAAQHNDVPLRFPDQGFTAHENGSEKPNSFSAEWIDPGESPAHQQSIQTRVDGPYLYLRWTISSVYSNGLLIRREICDMKKSGDEWAGKCVAAVTVEQNGSYEVPICDGIQQAIVITLLSGARIEGRIEHLDFPKNFPKSCPRVHQSDWRSITLIPKS